MPDSVQTSKRRFAADKGFDVSTETEGRPPDNHRFNSSVWNGSRGTLSLTFLGFFFKLFADLLGHLSLFQSKRKGRRPRRQFL